MELLDDLFNYDSRVYRTLVPLMTRPGLVCQEYLAGKRYSHLPPFRLYLFASIIFFLVAPLLSDVEIDDEATHAALEPHTSEIIKKNLDEIDSRLEELDKLDVELQKLESVPDQTVAMDIKNGLEDITGDDQDIKIDMPFLSDDQNTRLAEKIKDIVKNRPKDFANALLNSLPTMMFILLPIFALFLKIMYMFSNRYYMEHIIVVLFGQSFLFFMLLVTQALDKLGEIFSQYYPETGIIHVLLSIAVALSFLWIPVYMFLTQKRVYGQSTAVTLIKFFIICTVYFMLVAMTLLIAVVWNIVTL